MLKPGDYIVVKITKITEDGAFGYCEEHDVDVFIPVSEITSRKDAKIKAVVKEGETKVVKVLKVREKEVDASIKRVYDKEVKKALEKFRRFKRAQYLYKEVFGDEMKYWKILEEYFGEVFWAFDEVARNGSAVLKNIIPRKYWKKFEEVAKKHIEISKKKIRGEIEVVVPTGNATDILRKVFSKYDVKVLSPPKYYVEVEDVDYKKAREKLLKILEGIEKELKDKALIFETKIS